MFLGTARDCAAFLPLALDRWQALGLLFRSARFLVAENDSTDGTKAILREWVAGDASRQVLTLDGIEPDGPRSARIAAARNRLLDEVRANPALAASDFLIMMDMDNASLAITAPQLRAAMALEGWDALFANQLFYYNDVWALRDERRSPDDWTDHVNQVPEGLPRQLARWRHLNWRNRPFWPWQRPVPVRSAFGAFGIYRLPLALTSRYEGFRDGREICEHVPFNEGLAAQGARLFVHPGLINMVPMPIYRLLRMAGML